MELTNTRERAECPDIGAFADKLGVPLTQATAPALAVSDMTRHAQGNRPDDANGRDGKLPLNREHWLAQATDLLRPILAGKGFAVPAKVRVACGFPSQKALARKAKRVGECWYGETSPDGAVNVFVSPLVAETAEVLGILVHELGHTVLGAKVAHKGQFVKFCKALHLEGKPTATEIGDAFKRTILPVVKALGEYPHVAMTPTISERKQGTRMLKVMCAQCGYTCRITQKWLDIGAPICPDDEVPMTTGETK